MNKCSLASENECGKRKNDSDVKTDSKNDKKPKIPIKLAIQMNSKNNGTNSTNPIRRDTISDFHSENKNFSTINVSSLVTQVFGNNEDEENEEMPFDAKMRMKNIGRETPTSTGPNSYGKIGSLGFVDARKIIEKKLFEKADEMLEEEEKSAQK
ncbi:PEST proteolytic signal-containing nuclear -like [Brachionus plicatilis]|uniref:PEST proteolytic signal-containing nuclear protein n=1 Tax=Brachionus plicatilis TaxID=10195 RepID=A0A3M7QWY0_BRAPC|nr:PEST proteolytic signal-containing nuclear -like [Brachionus plicatilis]